MALPKHTLGLSDDESDIDEEYFARTYRPLSNLPTPPPSKRNSFVQCPKTAQDEGRMFESTLLGPAVHLANLLPTSASLLDPSTRLVHEMLVRANLPLDTIALAVCILDSLNRKFSLNWRRRCPLPLRTDEATGNNPVVVVDQPHIDLVRPELIILTALTIAVKFLEDCHAPTQYYAQDWGAGLWSCEQVNVTERCIMENLGYRILPLWDKVLIGDALDDMARAGRQASAVALQLRAIGASTPSTFMSSGRAVAGLGNQITPAETPRTTSGCLPDRHHRQRPVHDSFADDVRAALAAREPRITAESLRLPIAIQCRNMS